MHKWFGAILTASLLTACGHTQPQRPSFKGEPKTDSVVVQLLTMNQQMADRADEQLAGIATDEFVLMDEDYWVKGLYPQKNQEKVLQESDYVKFEAQFFSLKGTLLTTHQAVAQLSKVNEIQALSLVLPLMQHHQHVTLLVPWYMAFGATGNKDVPPYENLRVELRVE